MSNNAGLVRRQATAFVEAISNLSPKEREQNPSAQYADRFNQVLALAKEAEPGLDPRLWPNPVAHRQLEDGSTVAGARYVEFETYARQIMGNFKKGVLTGMD
ncbi:hypothetical protein [Myxococcus sp. CA039A]|uniref:hypothetical protein n=1 Tax=Myxococcus sp. CA039A TaxID=2741737 RepID=UPI00157BB61A|nr:hypothetical protein [Myxococcus sp. CA039A]NTX54625.1 hypothetical protein [Myxococcus sp. CA039A]